MRPVERKLVKVVNLGYLKDEKNNIPEDAYRDAAETVVFILIDRELAGYILLADEIRALDHESGLINGLEVERLFFI